MKRPALSTGWPRVFCKTPAQCAKIIRPVKFRKGARTLEAITMLWNKISTDPVAAALAGFLVSSLFLYGVRALIRKYGPKK